jgi:hypothetical protein
MSDDISRILAAWPYDDDSGLQVRRIKGKDGSPKIQMRIDLGLIQMELSGRPDGTRPFGFTTLLDHYRHEAQAHREDHGWYEGFELDSGECAALRQEALQFYHRRIASIALQDYGQAVADADHNLELLDFLKAFARNQEDWLASEQYRAFIMSHRVQALAMQHLSREDVNAALLEVSRGLRQIREIFAAQDREEDFEDCAEAAVLQDLQRKLEARYQVGHKQRLHILLDDALRREDPDTAADLRAQLRRLEVDE